jgi:putative oxidoreductase
MNPLQKLQNPSLGLFLIRAMLAVVFLFHGAQKLFGMFGGHGLDATAQWMGSIGIPLPWLSALLASLAELLGGAALATGVLFRLLLLPLAGTMFVAAFVGHAGKGFAMQDGGMEYPLTLGVVVVGLLLTGPGALAIGRGEEGR